VAAKWGNASDAAMEHNQGVQQTGNARVASVINPDHVSHPRGVLRNARPLFRRRRNLFLEILALRQQLAALKRQGLAPVVRASIDKPALAKTLNLRPQQNIILAESVGYQRSRSGVPS
jgi:hypothetical protein